MFFFSTTDNIDKIIIYSFSYPNNQLFIVHYNVLILLYKAGGLFSYQATKTKISVFCPKLLCTSYLLPQTTLPPLVNLLFNKNNHNKYFLSQITLPFLTI